MLKFRSPLFATVATSAALLVSQTGVNAADKPVTDPAPTEFLSKLDPQMKEVVEAMLKTEQPPLHELEPAKARKGLTFADAVIHPTTRRRTPI